MGKVLDITGAVWPRLFPASATALEAVGVNVSVPAAGVIWKLLKVTADTDMASA